MIKTLLSGGIVCVLGLAACGGTEAEPDETAAPPDTATETTSTAAPDDLDCAEESRMVSIVEPVEGFAGYESPEAAAAAIAGTLSVETTPTLRDGVWYMETSDGRFVARTSVEEFGDGWWAGELTACGDLE